MTNTILDRIMYRMKVTALIPDQLIKEVQEYSGGKTITDSLIIALKEWTAIHKIKRLNQSISKKPLEFRRDFSAASTRELNRK